MNSVSAQTFTLLAPTLTGNAAKGQCIYIENANTGLLTIATVGGTLPAGQPTVLAKSGWLTLCSDGTNYQGEGDAGALSSVTSVGANCSIVSGALNCSGGTGGGVNPLLEPSSYYTSDTAGNLFPYIYTGSGGNASASEAGWGVAASLASDVVLQMRFQMPPSIPSTGTFKLVSYCQANATTGTALYTPSDAIVAAGSSPSAATLTTDTQVSSTWTAADVYVVGKTTLAETPSADGVSVVALTFNHTSWTLAQIMSCRWVELWE